MSLSQIVVSVVNVPGSGYGYLAPAIYEGLPGGNYRRILLPLGMKTAKSNRDYPVGFRSARKAEKKAREIAAEYGTVFVAGIRHGSPVVNLGRMDD